MFRSEQIYTESSLLRNFTWIAKTLSEQPQAVLVTRKNGGHLVLANAAIFEGLVYDQVGECFSVMGETTGKANFDFLFSELESA